MTDSEFTDDQIIHGIRIAISEKNFEMVPNLIKVLALQAPKKAALLLAALVLASEERRTNQSDGSE